MGCITIVRRRTWRSSVPLVISDLGSIVFVLTSIAWREAWKYRDRAYRYCLLDMGHAWQSLALAARSMGCDCFAAGHFGDDEVAQLCGLSGDEWPMLIVQLRGGSIPVGDPDAGRTNLVWRERKSALRGADCLSADRSNTCRHEGGCRVQAEAVLVEIGLPLPAGSVRSFGDVVRTRRSALDFVGGTRSMTLAQLRRFSRLRRRAFPPISPARRSFSSICTCIALMVWNRASIDIGRSAASWN